MKIPLTRGKFATVGPRDYKYLMQWKWFCNHRGYASRHDNTRPGRPLVLMHNIVLSRMGCEGYAEADHANRDTLDNRRKNLRAVTRSQNRCNRGKFKNNSSGYKGVHWHKRVKKWVARIQIDKRSKHLGCYDNVEEASKAYDKAALKYHGEFAVLNEV